MNVDFLGLHLMEQSTEEQRQQLRIFWGTLNGNFQDVEGPLREMLSLEQRDCPVPSEGAYTTDMMGQLLHMGLKHQPLSPWGPGQTLCIPVLCPL